jgi:preprotein translocase subunit SecG
MDSMGVWEIIGGVMLLIVCVGIVLMVLMQESPKGGISAITGGDSYYNKNQSRTLDATLARFTKYFTIAFFVIAIAVYAADVYLK